MKVAMKVFMKDVALKAMPKIPPLVPGGFPFGPSYGGMAMPPPIGLPPGPGMPGMPF